MPVNDFPSNILQDLLGNSVHFHQANLSRPAPERKACVAIRPYRVHMRGTVIVREDNDSVGADAEHRGHMMPIVTQPLGFNNIPDSSSGAELREPIDAVQRIDASRETPAITLLRAPSLQKSPALVVLKNEGGYRVNDNRLSL